MWNRLSVAVASTFDAVTLQEAKDHLNIDHADDDDMIERLIKSAGAYFDGPNGIGLALTQRSYDLKLDEFPCNPWSGAIELPIGPVTAITSIKYFDKDNVEQTLSSSLYESNLPASPTCIRPVDGQSWPSTKIKFNAVTVRFVAGAATAADVLPDIKNAVLMVLAHLYANREAVITGTITSEVPMAVQSIVGRHWVGRFG